MSLQKGEVLVVVGDPKEQQELQKFLSDLGFLPLLCADGTAACELAEKHSLALALVDANTPVPGAGLEVLWALKRLSPTLPVVLLTGYKSFEIAVAALRAGAADVVVKSVEHIDYLQQRVRALCAEARSRSEREELTTDLAALNEEFLRKLLDTGRRVGELRDQLQGQSNGASPLPEDAECRILLVEEDGWLAQALVPLLPKGFVMTTVVSGGSALDRASSQRYQMALVKEGLPDLPGRMVVRTLGAQAPDMITLLFTAPSERPGQVLLFDGTNTLKLVPELTAAAQLAERLPELRDAQRARGRERRYLSAFREENYDLLRRHAELRQRLEKRRG